ncbi:hypothetical protein GALMADRAFT_133530 [Galerina marginata CBS 339.88]|uniref:Thioesterase domain-containing protein n=1 Tax=Galerina marginata (strain CBS 339.88) TaxID=685588 RepID=A0A067TLS3_GALM3|nr:hypothetical protein GALMADRAFT_133530 [Galerina marginata CBS 339.88]
MSTPNKHWPALSELSPDDSLHISPEAISRISGNAPLSIKEAAVLWYRLLGFRGEKGFGYAVRRRLEVKEVAVEPSPDDPEKLSAKMVCELEVVPDMCNAEGVLSHGCMAGLMDEGSAIALLLMRLTEGGDHVIGVSQTLNVFFHHPAPGVGSRIRIVNRSVSTQDEVGCCQSEIWDIQNHRLIVTGSQLQMMPSTPAPSAGKNQD